MTSLTISLPDPLKKFVEAETSRGGFSTVSDYFESSIQGERKRKAQEKLEELLIEGLDSEPGVEVTQNLLNERKQKLKERHQRREGQKS